jgi:hypothetical protein
MAAASSVILGGMAAAQVGSSVAQADAERRQGKFQQAMARINERRTTLEAEDAMVRGEKEAGRYQKQVNQVIGQQRSGYAAQGVVVSSGTAASIQEETAKIGAEDVQTIRNNAFREAMGFKNQAQQSALSGRMARRAAEFQADQTLISGGLEAARTATQIIKG